MLLGARARYGVDALLDFLAEDEVDLAGDAILDERRLSAALEFVQLLVGPLMIVVVVTITARSLVALGRRLFPVLEPLDARGERGQVDLLDVDLDDSGRRVRLVCHGRLDRLVKHESDVDRAGDDVRKVRVRGDCHRRGDCRRVP